MAHGLEAAGEGCGGGEGEEVQAAGLPLLGLGMRGLEGCEFGVEGGELEEVKGLGEVGGGERAGGALYSGDRYTNDGGIARH